MYFIYALTDPRTDTVAYVRITNNAYERFKQHTSYRDKNGKKHAWIQQLQQEKVMPAMKILEVVEDEKTAIEREGYWMRYYMRQGAQLTNIQFHPVEPRTYKPIRKTVPSGGFSIRFSFSPSTINDLWAEFTLNRSLHGEEYIVSHKQLLEYHELNGTIFMNLKEEGRVVAYSSLMPLEEDAIRPLLLDEIRERDIPLTAIRQWTDPRISVYIASITVKPTGNLLTDRERGLLIIRHTLKWALSMDRQFDVKNWYGIGATKEGQRVFERLGFTEIISLYGGERKAYYIDDVKKPVRLINHLLQEMRPDEAE